MRNSRKCAKTWITENVSWSQKRLGFLPSSLWKVFLKFFLKVNPIPIRKNSDKASVHRAFSRLKRKTRMFFRRFFRLSANFRPYSSAIFHPNTPHNFLLPVINIYKWWFEQKKSPHLREKCFVPSYLKITRYRRYPKTQKQWQNWTIFRPFFCLQQYK